jgi:hypothetical protein
MTAEREAWVEANQRYLSALLASIRKALIQQANRSGDRAAVAAGTPDPALETAVRAAADALPAPSAIDGLCAAFGLSEFERHVLLLCAGVELESSFADACAIAQGDPRRAYPTFSLALSTAPGAHWSAVSQAAPLRGWRLIEVGSGETLTTSRLRIDEPILHYLAGLRYGDDRLQGFVTPVPVPDALAPSARALAQQIARTWSGDRRTLDPTARAVVQLCGPRQAGKSSIAASACAALGLCLHSLRASDVPSAAAERAALARLWDRDARLTRSALLIDCEDLDPSERATHALRFVDAVEGFALVATRDALPLEKRRSLRLDVQRPTADEQHAMWSDALGSRAAELNGSIRALVSSFHVDQHTIADICATFAPRDGTEPLSAAIWRACRARARVRLDGLAQRIESPAAWDDLVLPDPQRETLRDLAAQVRHRFTVYQEWGFAGHGERGLGVTALFAGPSGTGKTLAAEVLANELQLDLYRIDLSQVVSKYIGETEKNLGRVFAAAEEGGAVLLFDEADALFGKRSEVKDSHDRYANIEVGYLLQRMETYRGLAILSTNMKSAVDPAFLRRIRFIVAFPFPDAAERAAIWTRMFPAITPTEGLDVSRLARLNVTGGTIRNIALNAAFHAADAGAPVRMRDLLYAARAEYTKLERALSDREVAGWSDRP